jgi:hypothetical protein
MATATSYQPVLPAHRHRRHLPCPICNGYCASRENHCDGFLSSDGQYAHCSRGDLAGAIPADPNGRTYGHRLHGSCLCGQEHGSASPARRLLKRDSRRMTLAKVHAELPAELDGLPLVAEYIYHEATGCEAYRKRKYSDGVPHGQRTYLQAHLAPEGKAGWLCNLEGCPRVLYHLPELLAADSGRVVHFTEGERDADTLAVLGLLTTTYSDTLPDLSPLSGRRVILHEDNDAAGCAHTAKLAAALAGVASSLRVIRYQDMPEKSDVTDWLEAGHSVLDLIGRDELLLGEASADPAEIASLRATIASQNEKLHFIRELVSIPQSILSAFDKVNYLHTVHLTVWTEPRQERRPDGTVPVYDSGPGGRAEQIGASPDAISASDKRLERIGLERVARWREPTAEGSNSRKAIACDVWQDIRRLPLPEREKQHGGKRYHCEHCLSENVTVVLTCKDCGGQAVLYPKKELGPQVAGPATEIDSEPQVAGPAPHRCQKSPDFLPVQDRAPQPDATLPPAPGDKVHTYARRVKAYQDAGMGYNAACERVLAENTAWWERHAKRATP